MVIVIFESRHWPCFLLAQCNPSPFLKLEFCHHSFIWKDVECQWCRSNRTVGAPQKMCRGELCSLLTISYLQLYWVHCLSTVSSTGKSRKGIFFCMWTLQTENSILKYYNGQRALYWSKSAGLFVYFYGGILKIKRIEETITMFCTLFPSFTPFLVMQFFLLFYLDASQHAELLNSKCSLI